jgi:hypothetical protein
LKLLCGKLFLEAFLKMQRKGENREHDEREDIKN